MRTLVLAILVLAIILSGCVGVNGEPLEIPDGQEIYDSGFINGCMSTILMSSSPQNLPPYDDALALCFRIYEATLGDVPPDQMSTPAPEAEPVIICDGNCI